jgi:hypothetical protein
MADMTTNPIPSQVRPLAKRTRGRPPSVYREELATLVVERVAEGETLRAICTGDGMPTATVFRRWAIAHKDLYEALQAARELKADTLFDEALDMARELAKSPGTAQRVRAYDVAMSQLRWSAGKLNPSRYSDRSQVSLVVPIQINTTLDLGQGSGGAETGEVYDLTAVMVEVPAEGVDDAGQQVTKRVGRKKT